MNRALLAFILGAMALVAVVASPRPAVAQCNPPVKVTIKFGAVPADVTFSPLPAPTPIPITVQVQNCNGAPVLTTDGFASTDFFRRLYFTDPNGGTIIDKTEEQLHFNTNKLNNFFCLSRNGVLLSPSIPVVPVQQLNGPPTPFFREYQIKDARALYDLTVPGQYSVTARFDLLTFDAAAKFSDCDQLKGTTVVPVTATAGQRFTVVSNTLQLIIAGAGETNSTITGTGPVLADGVAASTVTITLKDTNTNPVAGVVPTFSATGTNNTLGACSATNASGVSTCSLQSTVPEVKTLAIVTPVAKTGGTVTFTAGGTLDHLVVSPATPTIAAGGTQFYTAEGFDASNISLGDITSATTFTIAPNGSCSGATCTATALGLHTVKGTSGAKTSPEASLTVAAPADQVRVWVGLFNSDDVGIRFDLQAIVRKNGSMISSGQLGSVSGGSSGFNNAALYTIPLLGTAATASPGTLSVEVLVRNACAAGGRISGTARLWFNGAKSDTGATRDAGSRLDSASGATLYFLGSGNPLPLTRTVGSARTSIDKAVGAKCGPYQSFGTWSITLP